ncbi:40S ribosomal protein S17 [Phytophthora cinnamomi]|uniref:40S ribosomal protein S17 n=1 Tax=Phytophthora cinnamomi TaxID=4785 RepID=UPI00355A4804|nr:40S ribosomal protein S17 [Phytophthora cinnamomi]
MPRAPGAEGGQRAWPFAETLSLDDVELRERQVLEDGEACNVSYAHSIRGRETANITYKQLRKVCSRLGVRYYKNKSKDVMVELIAQKKLKGQVPESYRFLKSTRERGTDRERAVEDEENRDPVDNRNLLQNPEQEQDREMSEAHQLSISPKRQRTAAEPIIITSSSATNTFLQPVSPAASDSEHRSMSTDYGSGIPSTPLSTTMDRTPVEMSLQERSDTFTLLRHVRQQILDVEEEIAAHTESGFVQLSNVKTQRLAEDLQFYLSERHALMQQLESSRFK